MKPSRPNRHWLGWGVLLVAGLGLGLWLVPRAIYQHQIAVGSVPSRPVLNTWPEELAARIARGEKSAQGYWRPAAGLTELSRLYHANGFYHEALQCLDGLQRLDPGAARWPHLQATILAEFGRLDEALPAGERAVGLAPDYVPARLRLGDVRLKANQTAAAAQAYAGVLVHDPDNPYALLGLAKCDLEGGAWTQARDHLEQAIKQHPDFIGALSHLVTVREHFEDKAGADTLRAIIVKREFHELADPWRDELADDCYDPYQLSVAAAKANFAGDATAARRWLERASNLAPNDGSYRRQLGKMLLETRDFSNARAQLEKAVALAPDDSEAWSLLIVLFTAQGDTAAIDRTVATGLVHCPQSAALHYTHGQRLGSAGRYPEAISEFQTAQRLRPNEANAYIDLALIYFRQERLDEAVAELKGALAAQPGHPLALEALARYAIGSGDEPAARHWIRQLRLQPRVPMEDMKTITGEFQQRFSRAPW